MNYKLKSETMKDLLRHATEEYIHQNITGWENVTCDVCGRNSDYEHGPEFPKCPVGLAIELRDLLLGKP